MSNNALLHFLASEEVSQALLYWIQSLPIGACQQVDSLPELRDTRALTEILCEIDENFFKDLRSVPFSDNSLWFLHLVQLKKLFLKLSSYVELFLHQDWSLLPVPDFKAVAQEASKESAHLNFIVAAVLLTSTHSGRSSRLLTVFNSFTGSQRRVLDKISEGFMNALQGRKTPNSPRKSLVEAFSSPNQPPSVTETAELYPRCLFPASSDGEVPLKSVNSPSSETAATKPVLPVEQIVHLPSEDVADGIGIKTSLPDSVADSCIQELQSEIKILKLQNDDLQRKLLLAQDRSALEAEAREVLIETQTQLFLLQDQLQELRSQRDFERLERNTLQAAFEAERAALEDSLGKVKKDLESVKELREERDWLQEALDRLQKEKEGLELKLADAQASTSKLKDLEQNQSRLLSALKKGQQFVLKQNERIRELESQIGKQDAELSQLRSEVERLKPFEPASPKQADLILL